VSAWGWGHHALRDGLRSGRTAIRTLSRFEHARQRTHIAGEVPAEGSPRLPGSWPRLSRADRYALFAACEAIGEAGLRAPLDEPGTGVYFGSATAGLHESELYLATAWAGGKARFGLLASQQLNGPGDAVARHLGVTGPVLTISSACASATLALEAALRDLRSGVVDLAITGGADSLCLITYSGFNALRAVDERPCRPYRRDRAGMSLGEGAGVLVLETETHAARRSARPLAEFKGAGASCDAPPLELTTYADGLQLAGNKRSVHMHRILLAACGTFIAPGIRSVWRDRKALKRNETPWTRWRVMAGSGPKASV
jgi:3-oxoacyl-(acyl-carrier-protein) synthase